MDGKQFRKWLQQKALTTDALTLEHNTAQAAMDGPMKKVGGVMGEVNKDLDEDVLRKALMKCNQKGFVDFLGSLFV